MDEVVTASPGEDSPLLNTEADTVYLPVTVSGGNAEVITGSDTGEGAAVDSPEGNSPYTVVFSQIHWIIPKLCSRSMKIFCRRINICQSRSIPWQSSLQSPRIRLSKSRRTR